ncbi:pentapeptide repeat-containing protein [uncultured Roseibium sp.]|uniref:pentapeptide repeat-containing protein n=1 Tax=uncultured Roseibium sp. TaxID=1936171 RepID=UPI0032176EA4
MANSQHLKWLLEEGGAAWNARRRNGPFLPDLQGANLQGANLPEANLQEADLLGADLRGANLLRANLQEANLQEADLRGANLPEANLQEADLLGANLQEANLQGADLRRADLQGADLLWANLQEANLQEANLQEADLRGADLRGANLQEADLLGANLQEANLQGADLRGADLRGANLQEADLQEANLQGADLLGADLQGADLQEAKLQEANLLRADLQGADLRGADLQGADLRGANLQEAKLQEADLRRADLQGADLQGANLQEANLQEADIRSLKSALPTKNAGKADFTLALGVTQSQLDTMIGDTGVLLPDHLKHPEHWPEWYEEDGNDEEVAPDPAGPFVFLSYEHQDREHIATIRKSLTGAGIPCWWDQDISPGSEWRTEIGQRLKAATVVLTFWTSRSTESKGVIEEASNAQTKGKLTHVRLDGSELPYGFAETQYLDLTNWQGSATDPRFLSLIQVLRDRLYPPDRRTVLGRVSDTGPVTAVPERGKIGITDTPPDGKPRLDDPTDLENRFQAVIHNCEEFLAQWDELQPNVPATIKRNVEKCRHMAETMAHSWYPWEMQIGIIEIRLEEDTDSDWRGIDKVAVLVVEQIWNLKPHLKREALPGTEPAEPKIAPEIRFDEKTNDRISDASDAVGNILETPASEDVFTEEAREFLQETKHELAEGLERLDNPNEGASQSRFRFWRAAIRGLAGFVIGAVTLTAPGTISSLLTNPEAAKTLHSYLKMLLELLQSFF